MICRHFKENTMINKWFYVVYVYFTQIRQIISDNSFIMRGEKHESTF